jgi:hypothetical protein
MEKIFWRRGNDPENERGETRSACYLGLTAAGLNAPAIIFNQLAALLIFAWQADQFQP